MIISEHLINLLGSCNLALGTGRKLHDLAGWWGETDVTSVVSQSISHACCLRYCYAIEYSTSTVLLYCITYSSLPSCTYVQYSTVGTYVPWSGTYSNGRLYSGQYLPVQFLADITTRYITTTVAVCWWLVKHSSATDDCGTRTVCCAAKVCQ